MVSLKKNISCLLFYINFMEHKNKNWLIAFAKQVAFKHRTNLNVSKNVESLFDSVLKFNIKILLPKLKPTSRLQTGMGINVSLKMSVEN